MEFGQSKKYTKELGGAPAGFEARRLSGFWKTDEAFRYLSFFNRFTSLSKSDSCDNRIEVVELQRAAYIPFYGFNQLTGNLDQRRLAKHPDRVLASVFSMGVPVKPMNEAFGSASRMCRAKPSIRPFP